jgi:hypothetical protein
MSTQNRNIESDLINVAIEQGIIDSEPNWKLVRERDGLVKTSKDIIWVEFNDDGTFKSKHDTIGIGFSLVMSPFSLYFTWQTTDVTEIVEQNGDHIKFRTKNSTYELFKTK